MKTPVQVADQLVKADRTELGVLAFGEREALLGVAVDESQDLVRPLCVDLDGVLVKSHTLFDALFQFARNRPTQLWRLPLWLALGCTRLKSELALRAPLDVARLPYNTQLLRFLEVERRAGRPIYLTTGADTTLARRVAVYLGIFDDVLASDGPTNITRRKKLAWIESHFTAFDYVGASTADLSLLTRAHRAMLANPTRALLVTLRIRQIPVARNFVDHAPPFRTLFKAIRVHQWVKNILLLAPLLFSHNLRTHQVAAVAVAFFCFSFMASANYLINDLLDIESDRRHPVKLHRPFASGDLSVSAGTFLAIVLVSASLALLPLMTRAFAFWLLIYILSTASYTFYLKRIPLVDVLLLSGLYTLRLLAGGAATGTPISPWLAGFSSFLFLSLGMVKRFSELENLRERGATASHGRGYMVSDIEQIRAFGTASAYAAVLVFSLYITRPDVDALYRHPNRLWLIVPLLVYWISRVWLLASRGELDEDPVIFAIRDRISLAVGMCVVVVAIFAL
jgi:4-hydroxybenzoate polyprenyltransferase